MGLSVDNKLLSTERHLKVVYCNWELNENGCITGIGVKVFHGVNLVSEANVYSSRTVNNTIQYSKQYHIQQYIIQHNTVYNTT